MNIGMLWFPTNKTLTLEQKIVQARDYYTKKYGRKPDLCLVHPGMMEENQGKIEIPGLTVRPYRPVLPGHFWVGIEDKPGGE
jgi:hypothetical protein